MLCVKLDSEGNILQYPYGTDMLRLQNPNVSFPKNITRSLMAEYNVYQVLPEPKPELPYTQDAREGDPVFYGNEWHQTWVVYDLSQEEIDARTSQKADEVRQQRDQLLTATDWRVIKATETQTPESPEWMQYREDLRNIPQQQGFPWNVVWPSQP
jgi:hypothetical protein